MVKTNKQTNEQEQQISKEKKWHRKKKGDEKPACISVWVVQY